MKRLYETVIQQHFQINEQMAFLSGPRQVGKTTISKYCKNFTSDFSYLNWDIVKDRNKILSGLEETVADLPLDAITIQRPLIVLDEIHKYKKWKNLLKGFFDEYKGALNIIVTGSAKLNTHRKVGDSLMGRYFLYRIHPLSVAELLRIDIPTELFSPPKLLDEAKFSALFEFGGYPEPFLKQDKRFFNQWQTLRQEQLIREDIRDLSHIQDLAQMELLAYQLQHQAGQMLSYTSLANKIRVSDQTIRRWINVLQSFYYCFKLQPWSLNISRSLIKEPKIFLWDWSIVKDEGHKIENFVASHLLKAVHFWQDLGFGKFGLYFIRDKEKREVDFLVTMDEKPWMLIEVKKSAKEPLSKNLLYFRDQIKPQYTFQLAFDAPFIEYDFRDLTEPKIIPLITFLSQLI